jgi:hypothetical protein
MRYRMECVGVMTAVAMMMAGCSQSPPKCSDPDTLKLVKEIILQKLGSTTELRSMTFTDMDRMHAVDIELPRASAFDEAIKKYTCDATLKVKPDFEMAITYESQLDDNGEHIVGVKGGNVSDLYGLSEALDRVAANSTPKPKSASTAKSQPAAQSSRDPFIGTWTGQLEGNGEMTVTPAQDGYDLSISVSSGDGCFGTFSGKAIRSGNVLTIPSTPDESCELTVSVTGNTASVNEKSCSTWHGAACGFTGTLQR